MRWIIGCESSGRVRDAFIALGHDAWSCDIEPSETEGPHIQDDVLAHLDDGWDGAIFHPPCTYLCNSGVRWLHTEPGRREKMRAGRAFFMRLWECGIPKVGIENPIPHFHADLPPYSQLIQPWMFGDGECKATCLWLRGLPPLMPTHVDAPLFGVAPCEGRGQSVHREGPGPDRERNRSRTFAGIARAMADQWSRIPAASVEGGR